VNPPDPRSLPGVGTVSSDGSWYWDGGHWLSAISPDGLWKWDGVAWRSTSHGSTNNVPRAIQPSPPPIRIRWLVMGSLLASTGLAAIVGGVAWESAAATGIPDWSYLSVLSGIVLVALLVTLGLLARPTDWNRAFSAEPGGWRLQIATSLLALGTWVTVVWLLIILGGILTVPDFLTGAGRGSGRDTLVGLLLGAGPTSTLGLLAATSYWRSLMVTPVPVRSATLWILGVVWLCGLPLLLVFSATQGGGQLVVALIGLLLPPLVGFVGLLAKREWGRVATMLACLSWGCTGFGLGFSVPLLLLLWLKRPQAIEHRGFQH